MKTATYFDNCLSYEQLQMYVTNKNTADERAQLYMHISTCELCACADNRFTAIPFTPGDLVAIHHEIDVKANATHVNPLTFAQYCIIIISLFPIFGFYKFTNTFSENKAQTHLLNNSSCDLFRLLNKSFPKYFDRLKMTTREGQSELAEDYALYKSQLKLNNKIITIPKPIENKSVYFTEQKINSKKPILQQKKLPTTALPKNAASAVEYMENINVHLKETVASPKNNLSVSYNFSDIIYIEDLKIANYKNYYLKGYNANFNPKDYTPPFKENKGAKPLLEDEFNQSLLTTQVLEKGLHYFNNAKYNKAIEKFQLLLENNPDDINALFYSGVAFYKIGKNDLASKFLEKSLQIPNNAFYPEAKWYLALTAIKNDKKRAILLLTEIALENGFYAQQAGELLKKI